MSLTSEVMIGGLDWKAAQAAVFCTLVFRPLLELFKELGFPVKSYHQFLSLNNIGDTGQFFDGKTYRDYETVDGCDAFFRCLYCQRDAKGMKPTNFKRLVLEYVLHIASYKKKIRTLDDHDWPLPEKGRVNSKEYLQKYMTLYHIDDTPKNCNKFCHLAIDLMCHAIAWTIQSEINSVSTRWCIESEVYNPEYSRFLGNMERVFYYWHHCGERFFKKYAQAQFEDKIPLRYHNRINDWLNGIPYDQTRNYTPAWIDAAKPVK